MKFMDSLGVVAQSTQQVVSAELIQLGIGTLIVAVATIGATIGVQALLDRAHRRNYERSLAFLRQLAE